MKPQKRDIDEVLERCLPSASNDSMEQVEDLGARVLHRLRTVAPQEIAAADDGTFDTASRSSFPVRNFVLASAAAVLLVVALGTVVVLRDSTPVAAENFDGTLLRSAQAVPVGAGFTWGEAVHTTDLDGATFVLADGSRVEMRAGSELLLEQADDGVRIQLTRGGVIVNAAKQRQGHLYVQTKDVTVSVVGTVFMVNTEEEGSRVAVIEGEVRVRHGVAEERLRRGEQVSTSPLMEPLPVKEEIFWSRNAEAHVALLQQDVNAPTAARVGSVTGVVRSVDGGPASGVRVTAMRADAMDNELRAMASLAETDAAGRYRLENVPPGGYYITAGRVDLPTFHPGTLEIAKGVVVLVSSAATVSGIDIVLQDTSVALPPVPSFARSKVVLRAAAPSIERDQKSLGRRRISVQGFLGAQVVHTWWTDTDLWMRLGVNDDQQNRIKTIAGQHVLSVTQKKSEFEQAEATLKRLLASESRDTTTVATENDRVLQLRRDWEEADSKMIQEIFQVLTDPQRAQLQMEMPQLRAASRTRSILN